MHCTACGHANPDDAHFCGSCGTPLSTAVVCASCGRGNDSGNAFCHGCGTALRGVARAHTPVASRPSAAAGERRHLTVLFSDLVGSTALAEELDPEDMRDLVLEYQRAATEAIEAASGFVAHFMGDGILAYFGYPEAHEDDAYLAVCAGLAATASAGALRERFGRPDIQVRVGIHTGEVVVTAMGAGERAQQDDIVGETPNVAARLQALAPPGGVVISHATADVVRGWFTLDDLGPLELKGISRLVPAYRVVGQTSVASRIDAAATRGLTPLFGRDAELRALQRMWDSTASGAGGVVVISGDAGIGKSRLVHELRSYAGDDASVRVNLHCSPHRRDTPLFPLVEHLRKLIGESDGIEARLDQLEKLMHKAGLRVENAAPLVAELLSLPYGDRWTAPVDSAERRKRQTLEVATAWLLADCETAPVLLVLEDAHWVDPTTIELFEPFFAAEPIAHSMVVITMRPDTTIPFPDRPHVRRMPLDRLADDALTSIVDALAGGKALPPAVKTEILRRTDGVPLFVEEITHAVLASDLVREGDDSWVTTAELPERLVPSTLRESLMSRLDRLGAARPLAQLMATAGREIDAEFLGALARFPDDELADHLDRLVESDLVHRRRSGGRVTYAFKHWLVQDVAYESLLRTTRQEYHRLIASTLVEQFLDLVEEQPEIVAHHLIAAGHGGAAVPYLQQAGERAHRRSADTEAINHLTRALELVRAQPPSVDRDTLELTLLIALGAPLTASKGYSVPEVEHAYTRAAELCDVLGAVETPQFFRALYGTWRVHLLRADYDDALRLGEQLLELASKTGTPTHHAAAHRALGSTHFYVGDDLTLARSHLEAVIDAGHSAVDWLEDLQDVVDPWVTCYAYDAWALWLLGEPDAARARSNDAQAIAHALQHHFTIALSLAFDSWLTQFAGDVEATRAQAARTLELATEQGFAFWVGWARIMWGWAESVIGDRDVGIAAMEAGLAEWRSVGSELGSPYFLGLLAERLAAAGRPDLGLERLREADETAARTGEAWWRSELERLRGELMADSDASQAEVEVWLRAAVDTARAQGSPFLERRALASARLHGVDC
jgi:class 3 adenylate cyclase/predicted ATPase